MLTALGSVYILKPMQMRWPAIFESPIQKMELSLDDLELGSEILKWNSIIICDPWDLM